jgi:hypothetical protein
MNPLQENFLTIYCIGRVLGYKEGYEKGLYALAPQVPYSVKGLWEAANKIAAEKHFAEEASWKTMYEQCVKNETASGK